MSNNTFTYNLHLRPAQPRSKKRQGVATSHTIISSSDSTIESRETHSHTNKDLLDSLGKNADGYFLVDGEKAKVGMADEATNSTNAEFAATARELTADSPTREDFLSRKNNDTSLGHITFNNGLTAKQLANLEKGATFGSYLPSLIGGSGAKIDEDGNAEVESIKVRSRMEVAELVVNRQTTMDADILLTEGDLVENVEETDGLFTLTLRREWEGYVTSLTSGAVVRGIYNDTSRGGSTFETTWLKVEQVNTANNAIRVSLYPANECPAGVNHPPRKLLKISRWGHTIDATRQATYLLSSREQRVCLLTNVTKPIIDASNISSWQGKLDGLTWRDAGGQTHQLTGYGNVMGSAYISGSLHIGGQLTGAIADKVNELGEENLLLEGNVPVRNSDYMTARYSLSKNGQTLKEGDKITLVMKAHLADGRDRFGAFVADGWISVARFEPIGNDLYKFTHVWPARVSKEGHLNDNRSIQIFAIPSNSATTTIEWVKLVRGSYASLEFFPSPEDVANAPILKARAERIIAEVEAEKSRLAAEYAKVHQLAQWSGEEGSRVINLNINYKAKADELLKAAQSFIADGLILTSIFDKKIPKSLQDEYRQTAVQLIAALREMQGKIEIGGVNLFGFHKGINLKCESWESDKLGLDLEWAPDIKGVRARVTKAGDGFIRLENYGLREHVMCTFSFRLNYPRAETKKIVNARIYSAREAKGRDVIPQAGWQYVTITALGGQLMTYNNSGIADIHFKKGNSLQVGDIIEIADIKIERGTVATAWTPAPEDIEWERQQTLTKINGLKASLDKAKSDLTTITDDAWRDGIITAAEGKSLTKAKLELLKSEKSYLLARADAVLAAHPQLATTHPTEYNQIREGAASNQNARWYYLLYAEGMINACEAFLAGNSSYIFNGGSNPTATRYEDLFSLWLSSKSLSEWYEFSRNSFEAAIIMADRGKDGARGERGLQGLQGEQGERGIPGERGADGRSSYTHIAYADNENGDGFSQDPNGKDYIGMYVDDQATDSNTPSDYRWSLIKGQRGEQGIAGRDGRNGENGKTAYLHIAYANSADGRTDFHLSDPTNRAYIGTYTDHDINDSEDPSDYRWSLIKGEKGDKGDTGKNGKDGRPGRDGVGVDEVKPQYAITSSATNPPNNNSDVGWSDTPIPWREGFSLWTRQKTIYTDGRVNYSTPILDNSWSGERLRRLMEDDLAVSKVSVGAEKGVAFAGRFLACENDGGNRVVRAFFNGQTSGTRPAFAAGVNHFGEDGESYSTAFYHNGSGHIGVLSFDNIGGAGSLHIFDRNDARKKLVELTDKPMPDAVQMAKENRVEVKYRRNGNFNQTFTGVNAGEPLYLGPDSSGWDGRGEIFSKPTDPEYDQDGLPHDRYDVYQIIPQWGVYNVDGNFRIPEGSPTGVMSGSLSIRVTPDAMRQGPPYAYDSWGGNLPNDRVAVYLINYSDGPRGYKLWDNGKDGELMSGDVNLSFLKDIVPGEYQLQVIITSYVGRPKVNISGSGVSYFIDPNRPYTAICGDGFMAYQSQQQYTFIKDGVLHAKGELRIPGLLAAGVVEEDGRFRSSWGSRLSHVQHRSRGEYLIHHTLGHTRYSVIVNPLGNGGLKVAQLAAHAGHVAWIYIKDVQSGCQMSDSMFTFAIIGHDD